MPDEDSTDSFPLHQRPASRTRRGDLTLEDRLEAIEDTQQEILTKLGDGTASFSTLRLRLMAIEAIVYGATGLGLAGLVGSVLYLVLKGGPAGHP